MKKSLWTRIKEFWAGIPEKNKRELCIAAVCGFSGAVIGTAAETVRNKKRQDIRDKDVMYTGYQQGRIDAYKDMAMNAPQQQPTVKK